jgi:hypothetical protein
MVVVVLIGKWDLGSLGVPYFQTNIVFSAVFDYPKRYLATHKKEKAELS